MGKKKERTDAEKVFANWNKSLGLFERGEYSLAIVRAAGDYGNSGQHRCPR
jgi:hypothetical protein